MYIPNEQNFIKLTKKGNLIPVYREVQADTETPVSAYLKIAKKAKYSFLLESVEGEEKIARFSFIAKDPELLLKCQNQAIEITEFKAKSVLKKKFNIKKNETPLDYVRKILNKYKFVNINNLPRFCGGLVGYFTYDIVRFFEKLPKKTTDDLKLPDAQLILAKELIIFDHRNHKIKVLSCVTIDQKRTNQYNIGLYKQAIKKIDALIEELNQPLENKKKPAKKSKKVNLKIRSNFTKEKFKKAVEEAKKLIRAGEIIQVVLSQRFEIELKTEPFNIYRILRVLNPSPYMYYLNLNGQQIIGSSPELLIRCENGVVETRPIAGTRPRGKTKAQDNAYAKDLLKDKKEIAEHIMLVDLGRNDLGRVCQQGTVHLSEFMNIEKYSHVMHIVSNVKGKLRRDRDDLDVLQAAFPAGTVSGAPKIRAMEIIEDLEKQKRGPYAGCIGYFSFSGNLDTCITIRTIITKNKKAYIQAGAGIVADSKPIKEYNETVNKARAQIMAIEQAHK